MTPSSRRVPRFSGVLVIDKPAGVTSHDIVSRVRKRFDMRKVGHLGTLDPMATGVLPITLGKATRLARFVPNSPKEYTGRVRLGQDTSTCDAEGEPVGESRPVRVESSDVAEAIITFLGTIEQVPPAYSAKKIAGVRAHRLARKGVEVELKPATVTIETFELTAFESPDLDFRVVCTGGTYIRSLARDLGKKLETGGHLVSLRRVQSGPFTLDRAVDVETATDSDIISPEQLLKDLPQITVDEATEEGVGNGREVEYASEGAREGSQVCIFNKRGSLIAVATLMGGWARPKVVLL